MKKKMKIYYKNYNKITLPMILISNKYLEEYGFRIGDEIEIEYSDDSIIIKKGSNLKSEPNTPN